MQCSRLHYSAKHPWQALPHILATYASLFPLRQALCIPTLLPPQTVMETQQAPRPERKKPCRPQWRMCAPDPAPRPPAGAQ